MRPDLVVVILPLFRQHLRFVQIAEQLAVQKLIPHPAVEALAVSILPRAARFNIGCDNAEV